VTDSSAQATQRTSDIVPRRGRSVKGPCFHNFVGRLMDQLHENGTFQLHQAAECSDPASTRAALRCTTRPKNAAAGSAETLPQIKEKACEANPQWYNRRALAGDPQATPLATQRPQATAGGRGPRPWMPSVPRGTKTRYADALAARLPAAITLLRTLHRSLTPLFNALRTDHHHRLPFSTRSSSDD
jgi:hypothetical protein